jgi:trans-aconitate methyltransferase
MGIASEFYSDYDRVIPQVCKPYWEFIGVAARAVAPDTRSICEVGIGTGNLSCQIRRRLPDVCVIGLDSNQQFLEIARGRIKNVALQKMDVFAEPIADADYVVSSLTLHHLPLDIAAAKLAEIANHGAHGFINFDLALWDGKTKEDAIEKILAYACLNFNEEDIREVRREVEAKDNPLELSVHREALASVGMGFNILARQFPFVVYESLRK